MKLRLYLPMHDHRHFLRRTIRRAISRTSNNSQSTHAPTKIRVQLSTATTAHRTQQFSSAQRYNYPINQPALPASISIHTHPRKSESAKSHTSTSSSSGSSTSPITRQNENVIIHTHIYARRALQSVKSPRLTSLVCNLRAVCLRVPLPNSRAHGYICSTGERRRRH